MSGPYRQLFDSHPTRHVTSIPIYLDSRIRSAQAGLQPLGVSFRRHCPLRGTLRGRIDNFARESPAQILPRSPGQPPHLCQPSSAFLRKNDLYQ
jgi:hypothetical protein